jgi:hypothetical protein
MEDMMSGEKPKDLPLPATVAFVSGIGILIVAGWLLMFHLLTERW